MFLNHKMLTWRKWRHWVLFMVMFPPPPPPQPWQHTKTSTLIALFPDLQFENLIYNSYHFIAHILFVSWNSICGINGIKIQFVSTLPLSITRKYANQKKKENMQTNTWSKFLVKKIFFQLDSCSSNVPLEE